MKAKLIDGRALAAETCLGVQARVEALKVRGIQPKLAVVLVGDNPASVVYVNLKEVKAAQMGIAAEVHKLDANVSQQALIALVEKLNAEKSVHGILVQVPLPVHIDAQAVLSKIDPRKDVDGLHTQNAGALFTGREGFLPCTPKGVMALIKSIGVPLEGKRAVMVGRSNLVGKPTAMLLMQSDATVTICHSKTRDLGSITRTADILVCAVGKAGLITADMVKAGAVVVDVGQSRIDGKWRGDVDFESVSDVAAYITPVPGGVGPMTITMLMDNTVEAAEKQTNGK